MSIQKSYIKDLLKLISRHANKQELNRITIILDNECNKISAHNQGVRDAKAHLVIKTITGGCHE